MNTSIHRSSTIALIALGSSLISSSALVGCSSSSTRAENNSNSIPEIDPALKYIQNKRANAIEQYNIASEYHRDEDQDKALAHYRKALEIDDQFYAAWNNMGQLLMNQGDFSSAVQAFIQASGLEPTDPRPDYNIGLAYQKLGWAEDAHKHFSISIERDRTYLPALRGLIRSAQMLDLGDEQLLSSIKSAQLQETDEDWAQYFSTQYFRVKSMIDK